MLRIQKSFEGNDLRLKLSGRIEPEHLAALEKIVDEEARDRSLTIDLNDVTLVDRDGVDFLARCEARGAKLENCPAYVRAWIVRQRAR